MLSDELYHVIERLRERMKNHQDKLKQNEALTRNALVDPLLRTLGWDTEDPALVVPEYKVGQLSADYALFSSSEENPVIVIEAKKLGAPLDEAANQAINYCISGGIRYFVLTDGRKWDVYETHKPVPIDQKKIFSFDILDSLADVCLDALVLWRRSTQIGSVRVGQKPLLDPQGATPLAPLGDDNRIQEVVNTLVPQPEPVAISPPPAGNWLPISQLHPAKGDSAPRTICFPDGSITSIKYWLDIPNSVVDWLNQQGKLDENCIPIQRGTRLQRDTRYILSTDPVHSNGTNFKSPRKAGQFYFEGSYNSYNHVENAVIIIEKAGKGVTPEQFNVRLPD